jgi:hypothetical protein
MPNNVTPSHAAHVGRVRTAPGHTNEPAAQRRRIDADGVPGPSGRLAGLPPRAAGPTLPLTPARAQLWQWTRLPAHELLLDNRAVIERTGVLDGACLLGTPGAALVDTPAQARPPGTVFLPSTLPMPAAPQVTLPSGEPHEVAQARRLVVGWLAEARYIAAEVHTEGASPDDEADAFKKLDKLVAPAMVAALNAANTGLNLVYAHCVQTGGGMRFPDQSGFGSVGWNDFVANARPGRFRVLIDNSAHNLALDVAVVQRPDSSGLRGSVLALNPTPSPGNTRAGVAAELADQLSLPPGWSFLIAEVAAQRSDRSCRIFALSMALKCQGGTFDDLHRSRLLGQASDLALADIDAALGRPDESDIEADDDDLSISDNRSDAVDSDSDGDSHSHSHSDADTGSTGSTASSPDNRGSSRSPGLADVHTAPPPTMPATPATPATESAGRVERPHVPAVILGQELMKPHQVIGPQFMKHAQSRNDVLSYIAARGADAQAPVNAKHQTLLERHDAHRVVRNPAPAAPGMPRDGTAQIYSASVELKRINFLDMAIRHAAQCGADEIQALSSVMQAVDTRWGVQDRGNSQEQPGEGDSADAHAGDGQGPALPSRA